MTSMATPTGGPHGRVGAHWAMSSSFVGLIVARWKIATASTIERGAPRRAPRCPNDAGSALTPNQVAADAARALRAGAEPTFAPYSRLGDVRNEREAAGMIAERDVDWGSVYQRLRRRLMATVHSLDSDVLSLTVPATPAWSVRDAVAHVIGIAHDLNAQRFDVTDPDEWTARQVRERRDATIDDLEVEWDREAPRFEEGLRLMGYEVGSKSPTSWATCCTTRPTSTTRSASSSW